MLNDRQTDSFSALYNRWQTCAMLIIMQAKEIQFFSVFTIDDGSALPNMGIDQYPGASAIEFNTSRSDIGKLLAELDPTD